MKQKVYEDDFAELVAEIAPITGTVQLSVLEPKSKLRISSLSIPKEAIPELIKYLQERTK